MRRLSSWCALFKTVGVLGAVALVLGAAATGCNTSDVGAPCQHAGGDVPSEPLISFPALACDQLMCVYAESVEPPVDACASDADCAEQAGGVDTFECVDGTCKVSRGEVLARSMCSTSCDDDDDCGAGVDGTACTSGFSCVPLMSLGDFCCEKVCVCNDGLARGRADDLAEACAVSDVPGCCDQMPRPDACG